MAVYAHLNILLMERVAIAMAPNGVSTKVTVPVITTGGSSIRPRGFALASATGDFSFKTGISGDLGDADPVTAADLASNAQIVRALNTNDELWLEGASSDELVVIRWFWAHGAADGLDIAAPYGVSIPTRSFVLALPSSWTALVPPTGGLELVIESIDANALEYRVDDGNNAGVRASVALPGGTTAGFIATFKEAGTAQNAWTFDIPADTGNPLAKDETPTSISLTEWDAASTTVQDVIDIFNNDPTSLVTLTWDGVGDPAVDLLDDVVANAGGAPVSEPFAGGTFASVVVNSTEVSLTQPYKIYLNEGDRLMVMRNGGPATIEGFWRYTG